MLGAHRARRERIGAALGERHVRGAEALGAAQQRAEVAGVGDAVQVQADLRSPAIPRPAAAGRWRAARRRRGSCARATRARPSPRRVQRSTFVPAAASSSAMRSLPRSSSTNASTGAMPAASAARSASSPSSTKSPVRLRSLASPSARAALTRPLARLVITPGSRSRRRRAPRRAARRRSRPTPAAAACPPSAPACSRRQSDGIAAQSASVRRPQTGVAAVAEQRARAPSSARRDARDRGRQRVGLRRLRADAAPQPPAVGGRVDLAAGRAQRRRRRRPAASRPARARARSTGSRSLRPSRAAR